MYIHGSFSNRFGEVITLHMLTNNDRSKNVVIAPDSEAFQFPADSPIKINSEVNDTMDTLLRSSATIRLLSRNYAPELFGVSFCDVVVNIYKGEELVFAGFVEPQIYSQPFNELWDEIEISCIDALSAQQYSRYRYSEANQAPARNGAQSTLQEIVTRTLNQGAHGLDILNGRSLNIYFDGSKALDSKAQNKYALLSQIALFDGLFMGGKADEDWTNEEVLNEVLSYLDLHALQVGLSVYIFSWESVKRGAAISWRELTSGAAISTPHRAVAISPQNVDDINTSINVCEVFNTVQLTADMKSEPEVLVSPLDSQSLYSPFTSKQLYMTEYAVKLDKIKDYRTFIELCRDHFSHDEKATITQWYAQVKRSQNWRFPRRVVMGGQERELDAFELYTEWQYQNRFLDRLGSSFGAIIAAVGKETRSASQKDNSPTSKIEMRDTLFIAVNGNGTDSPIESARPTEEELRTTAPVAEYISTAGGTFSPVDEETTNYIVFSGKLVLNPRLTNVKPPEEAAIQNPKKPERLVGYIVPTKGSSKGALYARKYWKAETPQDAPTANTDEVGTDGLVLHREDSPGSYEFKFSAIGDGTDQVSKVGVIACMLIVGDKCAVEVGSLGRPEDVEWRTYKTREQCNNDDEYFAQSFTLGIDPKIGDYLVGKEYSLQNNIHHTLNINAEGTAIRIRKADRLRGKVEFKILGAANIVWDEVTRRHKTFFRRTKWKASSKALLANVSNIQISGFEVKVYNDRGGADNAKQGAEVVYTSEVNTRFKNAKEIEAKLCTAITAEEARRLGVEAAVNLYAPTKTEDGEPLLTLYDYARNEHGKPEQLRVDSCYKEYKEPRVIMEQTLTDTADNVGAFYHYTHPALDKLFFVQGVSRNLIDGNATLTLKEIGL